MEDNEKKPLEAYQETKDKERDTMLDNNGKPLQCYEQNGNISGDDTFFFNKNKPSDPTFLDSNIILRGEDLSRYLGRETAIWHQRTPHYVA